MKLLEPAFAIKKRRSFAYRLRLFDPRGYYPKAVHSATDALYSADDELVFSIVLSKPYDQLSGDLPYSEMDWITPHELRLWASILLCEETDSSKVMLYPQVHPLMLADERLDLSEPRMITEAKELIQSEAKSQNEKYWNPELRKFVGSEYQTWQAEYANERQQTFYEAIDIDNHCLLRGLGCLIKCDMLSRHNEFAEEAALVCFIALEASYSLIADKLRQSGIAQPTAKDVGHWLDDTFNRPVGLNLGERAYFEELYERRVMTLHPKSRFGVSPFAPLMHDDYLETRADLREIFAYLVSGEHGPEFFRRLREHERRN
jgi:hypothetical protein